MNADEILPLQLEDKTQGTESYLPSGWHGKFELFVVYNDCIKENIKLAILIWTSKILHGSFLTMGTYQEEEIIGIELIVDWHENVDG